jgi:hypothetical protein
MADQPNQNQNSNREKMVRGVVARGRTIDICDAGATKQIVGYSPDGKPMTKLATRTYGPDQEVELPLAEILSLRERGFLTDPDKKLPPLAEGPRFTENAHHASAA